MRYRKIFYKPNPVKGTVTLMYQKRRGEDQRTWIDEITEF